MTDSAQAREAFCSFCQKNHAIDAAWREMSYSAPSGALRIEPVNPDAHYFTPFHDDPARILVCGQLGVLTFTERFIQQGDFHPPTTTTAEAELQPASAFDELT